MILIFHSILLSISFILKHLLFHSFILNDAILIIFFEKCLTQISNPLSHGFLIRFRTLNLLFIRLVCGAVGLIQESFNDNSFIKPIYYYKFMFKYKNQRKIYHSKGNFYLFCLQPKITTGGYLFLGENSHYALNHPIH